MADHGVYPSASHYIPTPQGYYAAVPPSSHMHVVATPPRQEPVQRKRPKYTRSKTGCLTCRTKKIKCDETKPNCMRCTHGQRECTWPDGVPTRKKSTPRREQQSQQLQTPPLDSPLLDTRPSTAGSSGISEASTPPTRGHTPPRREPIDVGLPPLVSRRHSEPLIQLPAVGGNLEGGRRQQISPSTSHGYPVHSGSNTHMLSAIPEMSTSYPAHAPYPQQYATSAQYAPSQTMGIPRISSHHEQASQIRSAEGHQSQWTSLAHVEHMEPYFASTLERSMVGQTPQQFRYQ